MFNTELETLHPKTDVVEPCGMTIGEFPEVTTQEEEQDES